MTTDWTSIEKIHQTGSTLNTNGDFNGNANGWDLGANWAYNSFNIIHTAGNADTAQQLSLPTISGELYLLSLSIGGTTGTVGIALGGADAVYFEAGVGAVSFYQFAVDDNANFNISPSSDFNGTIGSVSTFQTTGWDWTNISNPSGNSYTNIAKPSNGSSIIYGGQPIGLLMALTYASNIVSGGLWTNVAEHGASWTNVPDNSSSWTNIPKAT